MIQFPLWMQHSENEQIQILLQEYRSENQCVSFTKLPIKV